MKSTEKIMIVDDELKLSSIMADILSDEGYSVNTTTDGLAALKLLDNDSVDLVLLDLRMPGMDGMEVLKKILERTDKPLVIMISAHGTIKKAVQAVQLGAFDFLEKPVDMERLLITVKNALEKRRLQNENQNLRDQSAYSLNIIGTNNKILKVKESVEKAARLDVPVLVTGENGTGKDLVVKQIHAKSSRADHVLAMVNCGAIPSDLIESELFGHEKGAFTGAHKLKKGRFEYADGGSLFLNEIGEMSTNAQVKLLNVLESGTICRLGSNKEIPVDVRIFAASNKDFNKAIANLEFRKDLFYRLNVLHIHLPALRERQEDVPLLAEYFIAIHCLNHGTDLKMFSEAALSRMMNYEWPGNVRELNHLIERLVIFINKNIISDTDVDEHLMDSICDCFKDIQYYDLREARFRWEKEFILKALRHNHWNIKSTASALGIERTHLHRLMKKFKIHGQHN